MKRIFFVILAVVVAVLVLSAISLPLLIGTEAVQSRVRAHLHKLFSEGADVGKVGLNYFPWPHVYAEDVLAGFAVSPRDTVSLHARSLSIWPDLLKVLFRKLVLSRVSLTGGEITYSFVSPFSGAPADVTVRDVKFQARDIESSRRLNFELGGNVLGTGRNVNMELHYDGNRAVSWWDGTSVSLDLFLKGLDAAALESILVAEEKRHISSGILDGEFHVSKSPNESEFHIRGKLTFENVSYRPYEAKDVFDLGTMSAELDVSFDMRTRLLALHEVVIEGGFADTTVRGRIDLSKDLAREGIDVELAFPDVRADALSALIPPAERPHVSISGSARLNVMASGGLNRLSVKSELNLSENTIRIRDFFEKDTGVPFQAGAQLLLEGKDRVSGEYEWRLGDAVAKGSIVEIRPGTSDYEITFLTNKFLLSELLGFFPSLRGVTLAGSVKWLLNMKGNLNRNQIAHIRTNVTAEKVSVAGETGPWIEDLSGTLDFQEPYLSIRDVTARIRNVPLKAGLEVTGTIPSSFNYRVGLGDGVIDGSGALDRDGPVYLLSLGYEVQNLTVAQILPLFTGGKDILEGTAFANGLVKVYGQNFSDALPNLKSTGSVRLTNGRLKTIDILGSLGTVQRLVVLAADSRGATRFSELSLDYDYAGGEAALKEGLLRSDAFDVTFEGTLSAVNGCNVPLEILLSPQLSRRVIPGIASAQVLRIPALLSGPLEAPQINVAASVVQAAVSSLIYNLTDGWLGKSIFADQQAAEMVANGDQTAPDAAEEPGAGTSGNASSYDLSGTPAEPLTPEEELVQTGIGLLSEFLKKK